LFDLKLHSSPSEIDVQLVGLIKTLIDPENIMTETAAVSSIPSPSKLARFFIVLSLPQISSRQWRNLSS